MHLIYATDVITQPLTGVGQYALALGQELQGRPEIESFACIDIWARHDWQQVMQSMARPFVQTKALRLARALLDTELGSRLFTRLRHYKFRQGLLEWLEGGAIKKTIFHSPTVMPLPDRSDFAGLSRIMTVHDMSHLREPSWHPIRRVERLQQALSQLTPEDGVIAVSAFTRQELLNYYPYLESRCVVIPHGHESVVSAVVQPVATAPQSMPEKPFVLCVSTIEPRKNIDTLLDAFRSLPAQHRRSYQLVLIGEPGWRSEQIFIAIRKGQAEGWLDYRGYVTEVTKQELYRAAHVVVYPSLYEGFGLPVLEAWSHGKRMITARHSAIAELLDGLQRSTADTHPSHASRPLVDVVDDPLDLEAWREALVSSILNEDDAKLAIRRQGFARSFTWRNTADRTIGFYKRMLEG